MSSSSAPKKRGLGRGPNHIQKASVNPDERILSQMRPHPDSTFVCRTGLRQRLRGRAHLSPTRIQFGQNFRTAVVIRASGAPEGNKAPGTYKGGSISQLQHVAARMDERYPEGTSRPPIDQELWERASVVKKNYVKGQGQRRQPTISGTGSSGSQSTQSSCQPMPHTAADCVRAIYRDCDLLCTLCVHLQSLDPDELADAVATAAQQETDDEARLDDNA
ncbi:hypothetical protein MRB53_017718 [Persea americana]|uniref:Uncharacterized protein n=1 Tax=Persea americana TaxID=3435 RepID=A0ACC2M6T5_PERAE|nr:hypothetical protein MRB53_017718 [Persea americana]